MEVPPAPPNELMADTELPGPPMHGYRGDERPLGFAGPKGMTIALSREAGSQGSTIAEKVGAILGWQVFNQEVLDYLMADEPGRSRLLAELPSGAQAWADAQLGRLQQERKVTPDTDGVNLARLVLMIAARGDAIIVGRGAGFLLPLATTLHVRVVAPLAERMSFFAQSLRLTREEAATEVRNRDASREQFVAQTMFRGTNELAEYDLIVNSGRLGVETAAQVVSAAMRAKHQAAGIADPVRSEPL